MKDQKNSTIDIFDLKGKKVKDVTFSFKDTDLASDKLLAQYIYVYQSNKRQGNASAKTRGEVIGSTKKIYKQKGTGRARHGSRKAPIFKGGGVVGGPKPKDYSLSLSKNQKKQAFVTSFKHIIQNKQLSGLVEEVQSMKKPSTKSVQELFEALKIENKKKLIVFSTNLHNNFALSARNIPQTDMVTVAQLNAYDILNHNYIFIMESAFEYLKKYITLT